MWSIVVGSAFAQTSGEPVATTGIDAHGFHLAAFDADPRDPLAVQRPGPFSGGDWFLSFLGEYATDLLVRDRTTVGTVSEIIPDNIVAGNISFGVAPHERVRLDVVAPVYLLAWGAEGALDGPAAGDVRSSVMVVPIRPSTLTTGKGFGLGLVGFLDLPLGPAERSFGRGALAGGGRLAWTGELPRVTFSGDFGVELNPDLSASDPGGTDSFDASLAFGVLPAETFGLTVEARAVAPLRDVLAGNLRAPPSEAILSMRYAAPSGAMWTLGGAVALQDGPGIATYRVFIGSGFGQRRTVGVRDIDPLGTLRSTDLCPLEPESPNGWKDDDGCPDRLGTLQIDVKYAGQSRSADAEIVGASGKQTLRIGPQGLTIDAVPGSTWSVAAKDGCLSGQGEAMAGEMGTPLIVELAPHYDANVALVVVGPKGEPLSNALVRWRSDRPECMPIGAALVDANGAIGQPVGSGTHHLVVTAPGFNVVEQPVDLAPGETRAFRIQLEPSKIVVEQREIRILEKVQFESAKAVLRPASYSLLNEVAAVILGNPGIGRVEVGGHTDNKGTEELNLALSQERADAVVEYLAAQGVPREQLLAQGYGETRPIDTNKTESGRERNRRVEFRLLDAPKPTGP